MSAIIDADYADDGKKDNSFNKDGDLGKGPYWFMQWVSLTVRTY